MRMGRVRAGQASCAFGSVAFGSAWPHFALPSPAAFPCDAAVGALRRWRARRGSAGCPSSGRLGGLARSHRGRSRRSGPWPSLGQLHTRNRATAETLGSRDWWRLRRRTRAMARVGGAAGEEAQGSSWALHPQVRLGKLVQGVPRRDARLGARHEGRPVEQVMRGAPRPLAPRCRMPCS